MNIEIPESVTELPFSVRCPQCGERFKSATNTANLCLLCECAEYDDVEPTDA